MLKNTSFSPFKQHHVFELVCFFVVIQFLYVKVRFLLILFITSVCEMRGRVALLLVRL